MSISKKDLLDLVNKSNSDDDILRIVRKHLIHGIPYVVKDNPDLYYDFRELVAKQWNVRFNEVVIMGSGKLGYSYHKNSYFSLESDIDVAIVSEKLFEDYYYQIMNFQYEKDIGLITLDQRQETNYQTFLSYMIKGWMRPDKLPGCLQGPFSRTEWFDYFKSISYDKNILGNYKINAGLFKSFDYMENYYTNSLKRIKK